jgi:hypothetical protein
MGFPPAIRVWEAMMYSDSDSDGDGEGRADVFPLTTTFSDEGRLYIVPDKVAAEPPGTRVLEPMTNADGEGLGATAGARWEVVPTVTGARSGS